MSGSTGVTSNLSLSQQLELIYIGYFNRAADGPGLTFWVGQDAQAINAGENAAVALTNIADSFTPQPETLALYPFLANVGTNLTTPTAQAGLATFIASVYQNLFDRAADSAGATYWLGQITSGAVGLGAAVLDIANGATGNDSIELQNKITVASDFTTRTNALGLGVSGLPTTAAFLTAAHNALNGVDGASLNDFSVTAGETTTTLYIVSATIGGLAGGGSAQPAASTNDPIVVSTSNIVVDPGAGSHTIQFLAGVSGDTVVLHSGGTDQIAGFNLAAGDTLDLTGLFSTAQLNVQDVLPNLGSYLTISDQGADAVLLFDPLGHGGGSAVAVLQNQASVVTSLGVLTSHNAVQV
jgi:hypothetical protein